MKVKRSSTYALHALMYMVRHGTQFPATAETMAKAEGIPSDDLVKILKHLGKARFVRAARGKNHGYILARPPDEISLLELLESIEGRALFDDCPLRHCKCGGTPENCRIFSVWVSTTRRIKELVEETYVAVAAWNHAEHRFSRLPEPTG